MSARREAFAAVRWTALAMIGRAAVQFAQVLVLARLLAPADFGLMAMVVSVTTIAMILTDLGVSNAIVHYQDITEPERTALYWLNVVAGALLSAVTIVGAPVAALFFAAPRLAPLLMVAGLSFVILAAGQQLRAYAQKEMRFGRLAAIEITAALSGAAVSIVLALRGVGVQSIAIGSVSAAVVNSGLAWMLLAGRWGPALNFNLTPARRFLSYGLDTIGVGFLNAFNMQSDVIVGGRLLPATQLGFYSLPRDLCLRLMLIVNPIITRVGLPMIARAQNDAAQVRQMFRQTMRMTASVNFPIYAAMSLYAPEGVAILFGPQWAPAANILRIAALAALLRSIGNPLGSLLYAMGRTRLALYTAGGVTLTIFPTLALGAQYGPQGLACANLVFFAAQIVPLWFFAIRPTCGLGLLDFLSQLAAPSAATAIAALVAALATHGVSGAWPRVLLGGAVGAGAYLAASYFLNRNWLIAAIELAAPQRLWARASG